MRTLKVEEVKEISGGELTCTAGFPAGVSCTGTLSDWGAAIKGAYNAAVNATTDLMCSATGKC